MKYLKTEVIDSIKVIRLSRGKVHALNDELLDELISLYENIKTDQNCPGTILTGEGKFFSFGLDVPSLLPLDKDDFKRFLTKFLDLYKEMFLFPKPLIAAINGHAIAGGCILALTADFRLMVDSGGKISLNETTLGASLFAGVIEMLKYTVGSRTAETIVLSGKLYPSSEAKEMKLIDSECDGSSLIKQAVAKVQELALPNPTSFTAMKHLLRKPVVSDWMLREEDSLNEFIEIWYQPKVQKILKTVVIK